MALNKQIFIYSVDTGAFYTNTEKRLHWKLHKLQKEKSEIDSLLKGDQEVEQFQNDYSRYKSIKINLIKQTKNKLLSKLSNGADNNKGSKNIRKLSNEFMVDKNVIAVFDSFLTRTLGLEHDKPSKDLIIVKVYYFDIMKDLIYNGFEFEGEKYRFFTASAGQIRTKKIVFIKESLWNKYEKTLMCGLTVDLINAKGGINANKYLAYLALSNSATDIWDNFDIHKCIVVDDFETMVRGTVDLIDDKTYEIIRQDMDIPIPHTDGCGMVLPKVKKKNFMVRLPWIKGLLAVFDFVKFIKEHNGNPIIKDIYGVEHNILEDDIEVIFTKSQFKMHKYYTNWSKYVDDFIKYDCQAGICNLEEDYIPNAKINYQMIQTLTDITDGELKKIAGQSTNKIKNITTTVKSMLEVFGVTKYNNNKTNLQQALEIYPELLMDIYSKEVLRSIKNSLVKNYKSAKLEIKGKYTFIVPDLYAFCEYLFLGNENPKGLLEDGEVFCKLYKRVDKLDCLRSPHLYREHAIRKNTMSKKILKWFTTNALYTSCHDIISKMLQFDCDGDCSLVVADKLFVEIAERNMNGVVPLYYNMNKAEDVRLNSRAIYNGLNAAYTGGNIGVVSNDITKIWNSGDIGEDELEAIKLLCMENNFIIDHAKTLYKPTRPKDKNELIRKYTKAKVPYFFMYAKDKTINQVEKKNNSVVNKLDDIIINNRIRYSVKEFEEFDYKMLMNNPNIKIDDNLINTYIKLNRKYHFKINIGDSNKNNIGYIKQEIQDELSKFGYCNTEIADMLVLHLYHIKNSKSKEALWFCYGDIIVENLKYNIDNKTNVCEKCGRRYARETNVEKYCDDCKGYQPVEVKKIICIDCGRDFVVDGIVKNKKRCNICQKEKNKERYKLYNKKRK